MSWFFYALSATALYSVSNFIDKFLIEKKVKDPLVITIIGGFMAGILGILIGLIRGFASIEVKELYLVILAGILLNLYILPYFQALKLDDTSRVVPLFQFTPIFVLVLSYIILREMLAPRQLVGFCFIIFGGFVLSVNKIGRKVFKPRPSLWYMLVASFMFGLALILFRFVVRTQDFWAILVYEYIGMGIGSFLLLIFSLIRKKFIREIRGLKSILGLIGVNDGITILAQMSESYAISLVPVAFVSIVGGTQPLFVLLYGLILSLWFPHILKEDIKKSMVGLKLAVIFLIFIGLYLIYF